MGVACPTQKQKGRTSRAWTRTQRRHDNITSRAASTECADFTFSVLCPMAMVVGVDRKFHSLVLHVMLSCLLCSDWSRPTGSETNPDYRLEKLVLPFWVGRPAVNLCMTFNL